MNIDFYLPERSQYNVLHHFTRKLYEAFVRKGFACRLLDNHEILQQVRKDPADLSISFNGAPQITPGVFLCDIVERPHITWLVDLPIHYLGLVESPWISIACDDEYSCQWLEQMGFSNCFFLPQAVETDVFCDPAKERQYDVVFFASYFDYQKKLNTLPKELATLFEEAAEKALVDVDTPFLEQLFDLYRQHPHVHAYDALALIVPFEHYLKGRARAELLAAFKEVNVHVFDERWKAFLHDDFTNITVHPAISYEESFSVMQNSKFVLNNSIRSALGGSERVVNAMMCGAVAITNTNPFIEAHFDTNHEVIAYRHEDLNLLEKQVQALLAHDQKRIQMAGQGQHKALEENTWDTRVDDILDYLNNHQN